jgi:hypothetical protein
MSIWTSFLQRLQHTSNIPVCCYFVSRCLAAFWTMEIPSLCVESELLYDWRFTANQFILASSRLRPMTNILFQWNTCRYVTSSFMRGLVCRLQLLLGLASLVILWSESCGTHDHILQSRIWDSSTWKARSPYLYPPGTGWPSYTPRHWVLFSSPPMTCRPMVEVVQPASTWGRPSSCIGVRITLRLAVYRQSVCLGNKLLETYDQ